MAIVFNSKGGLQVSINHCFSLRNKQKNVQALTHKRVNNENFSEEYLNEKIQTLVQENQIHAKINRSKPLFSLNEETNYMTTSAYGLGNVPNYKLYYEVDTLQFSRTRFPIETTSKGSVKTR